MSKTALHTITPRPPPPEASLTPSELVFLNGSRFASERTARKAVQWGKLIGAMVTTAVAAFIAAIFASVLIAIWRDGTSPRVMILLGVGLLTLVLVGLAIRLLSGVRAVNWSVLAPALDTGGHGAVEELMTAYVAAALLAREKAGAIRLVVETAADPVLVVRSVESAEFPEATLEQRLVSSRDAPCKRVVYEWLTTDSMIPWARMLEQAIVMGALRGVVHPLGTGAGRTWGRCEAAPELRADPAPALELLDGCRTGRPEVWRLLQRDVAAAVRQRTHRQSGDDPFQETDPWLDEARADREAAGYPSVPPDDRPWGLFIPGGTVWMFLIAAAVQVDARAVVWSWILFASALFGLACLPSGPLVRLVPFLRRAFSRSGSSAGRQAAATRFERALGLVLGAPLLASVGAMVTINPGWAAPITALALLLWAAARLRERARRAVRLAVSGTPDVAGVAPAGLMGTKHARGTEAADEEAVTAPQPALDRMDAPPPGVSASAQNHNRAGPATSVVLPFELVVRHADALPPLGPASRSRIERVNGRGPALRAVYIRSVAWLATFSTAVAVIVGLFMQPVTLPFYKLVWLTVTALFLSLQRRSERLRRETREAGVLAPAGNLLAHRKFAVMRRSPRRYGLHVLGWTWVVLSLLSIPPYLLANDAASGAAALLTLAAALAWIAWVRRQLAALDLRYPNEPPLDLLALRVFRSPYLDDFLDLTDLWQWLGTRQRLEGPETAGSAGRDLLNYVSGRIGSSVIGTETQLRQAVADFRNDPDEDMRFPVNAIQCADATWRTAVQLMLDRADVVVADLSAMTRDNQGVAYEIGLLLERMPLERVVLLVHDSTDMAVLREVLATAAASMTPASPNFGKSQAPLVIHLGGSTARLEDESVYDWRRRMHARINDEHLVGLLVDAATPPRSSGKSRSTHGIAEYALSR